MRLKGIGAEFATVFYLEDLVRHFVRMWPPFYLEFRK